MPVESGNGSVRLTGHRLRNANLRQRSLARAEEAPPLARAMVHIRAQALGMTRLEFARRSGIKRGTLRDAELGVHIPTRRIVRQFLRCCRKWGVGAASLDEVCRLYTGPVDTLGGWLASLELQAGSPRALARRVGISPATLWEYRRGNFPVPLPLLRRLCQSAGAEPAPAEALWLAAERQRLRRRSYPEALAEFWVHCARLGHAEKHLLALGLGTAAARRLRYLELPPWEDMAVVVRALCPKDKDFLALKQLWARHLRDQDQQPFNPFGQRIQQLRRQRGISRRELADLFRIGGKKPARIIKYIEEDGFYSARAYPAGLAALLARDSAEQDRLLERWRKRRLLFHRRHRPETRTNLRLAREMYGFGIADMEPILGYSSLEYQRIERGTIALADTASDRILQAILQAGQKRIAALAGAWQARQAERVAWQSPPTVQALFTLLARREGGLIGLARFLDKAGLRGLGKTRLRTIARRGKLPTWPVVEQVARACGVVDLSEARQDWSERYRVQLQKRGASPLGVEIRALIAETDATVRAFNGRLGLNCSVLVRNLQGLDRDEAVSWRSVERILRAAGLYADHPRWREIRGLWYTADSRRPKDSFNHRQPDGAGRR